MDLNRFDDLARVLSGSDTRRRVLGLVAALPAVGTLLELLTTEEAEAKDRRRRRKQRHKARKHPGGRKGKGCRPKSQATVCAGTCGPVTNRQTCGKTVDCGACTCATGCPECQTCNPATGLCDPVTNGTACNDGDACTTGSTCVGGTCGGGTSICTTPLVCQTAVGATCAGGTCTYASKADGTSCGTQSVPGGGATHCCNGSCPDPDCVPAGQLCPEQNFDSCESACCTQGANLIGGIWSCVKSGFNLNMTCGSDVDCTFGICQCGICCVPSGAPVEGAFGDAGCCSGASSNSVCT